MIRAMCLERISAGFGVQPARFLFDSIAALIVGERRSVQLVVDLFADVL